MLTLVQVCRVVRDAPFSAKRRPKFISVTISGARFWERSTLSNWFNLYENRYNPLYRMSRRAEALGYARRSPPARAGADYFFKDHKESPLQKGHVTAAAQRSQRTMPERVAPTHHASPCIFLKFSARSASRRCVFAAKS